MNCYFKKFSDKIIKDKISIMFPGQGFQFVGMLNDFVYPFNKDFQTIIDKFDFVLNKFINRQFSNLLTIEKGDNDIILKEKRKILNETKIAQPAILLQSILNFKKFLSEDVSKEYEIESLFGPSLGEIIALVAGESIDYEKGAILLYKRGECMQESCPEGVGAMLNVVGQIDISISCFNRFANSLDFEEKENINISSINSNRLIVISGKVELIEKCIRYMKDNSIACKKLPVSAAFHSKQMIKGQDSFKEYIYKVNNEIEFNIPKYKILSTIKTDFIYDNKRVLFDKQVKELLIEQFIEPVNLLNCVRRNINESINVYDLNKRKIVDKSEYL